MVSAKDGNDSCQGTTGSRGSEVLLDAVVSELKVEESGVSDKESEGMFILTESTTCAHTCVLINRKTICRKISRFKKCVVLDRKACHLCSSTAFL